MRKNLYGVLLLLFITFGFTACEKDEKIDISLLEGAWSVANDDPHLIIDGMVVYNFDTGNKCSIVLSDALSGRDTTINRTYLLSFDNTVITLLNEEERYTEQYRILKLTPQEMKWENASPDDGNSNKRLVKVVE